MSFTKPALYTANPNTARGVSTKLAASKEKIVYTNGRAVFIRDINNPGLGVAYTGHIQPTTVARISPTGYYCASADVTGTVRVWDTVGEDQSLKGEYKVIGGRINDLEWDGESKRIIAVGDGREKYGHAFMFDTGTSTGEIIGHSKAINAVSIRHQRPFRAATAADDNLIVFHQGTPYKYDKTIKSHTKFVQDLRYAPSGDHFASVGSDGKVFLYDGKAGDILGEFEEGHKGTAFGVGWSPDSKALSTSSADGTVKIWDIETRKATTTYALGSGLEFQQVGNVWSAPDTIISLSFTGELNVFDRRTGEKPVKVLYGPQKAITSAALSSSTFMVGTADGRILSYDSASGEASPVSGQGHTNLVAAMTTSVNGSGKVYSAGFDDRLREVEGGKFTQASAPTGSQPKSVAAASDGTVFIVGTAETLRAVRDNQVVAEIKMKGSPSAVAASGNTLAVGTEDQKVRLFDWDGKDAKETALLEGNKGVVSALAFSPDGTKLAAGDSSGKIVLFDAKEHKAITSRWSFHSARISSLSWASDSLHCASGSLDTHIYIWSVEKPLRNIAIKNAVSGGVNVVFWLGESTASGGKGKVFGAGADGVVRIWEIKFHQ